MEDESNHDPHEERRGSTRRKLAAAAVVAAIAGAVALPGGVLAGSGPSGTGGDPGVSNPTGSGSSSFVQDGERDGDCPHEDGESNEGVAL
jgi:hypothetical protein